MANDDAWFRRCLFCVLLFSIVFSAQKIFKSRHHDGGPFEYKALVSSQVHSKRHSIGLGCRFPYDNLGCLGHLAAGDFPCNKAASYPMTLGAQIYQRLGQPIARRKDVSPVFFLGIRTV